MNFFWFLPTHGDGEYLNRHEPDRHGFKYYLKIVQSLESLGYEGILIPTGSIFEDSWICAAALAGRTAKLKYLVALHPSSFSPAYAARQVAAFDRLSNGRTLINIVVGSNRAEMTAEGHSLSPSQHYEQADEFLRIYKALMTDGRATFSGAYYNLMNAKLQFGPHQHPYPPLYAAGTSESGLNLAARHADWYIMWADPVEVVAKRIEDVRARAGGQGRTIRFGIRVHFVVRETRTAAWREAERLVANLSQQEIAEAINRFRTEAAHAQKVSFELHRGDPSRLEIAPDLWAGVSLARGGAVTALVGDPGAVRARLQEYEAAGVDLVIGSATPHLEGAEVVHRFVIQPSLTR